MAVITIDVLDALLSAGAHRGQAESYIHSLATADRATSLVHILPELRSESQVMLAAVLLRRDIAALAGDALRYKLDVTTSIHLLKELVDPLTSLVLKPHLSENCRRQLSHCLPELCSSLSVLSETDCDAVLTKIFGSISPLVCDPFGFMA